MSSRYPSEVPQWGWVVPNLMSPDLARTVSFYDKLGFRRIGGQPSEGWAILANGLIELHVFGAEILKADLLNYRGGELAPIRAALASAGISIDKERGPSSFSCFDPDGREVFFDIGEPEVSQLRGGQALTIPLPDGVDTSPGDPDLGNFTLCFACADVGATRAFYEALGFVLAGGDPEQGWVVLARADHLPTPGQRTEALYLCLFGGMIPRDMLNFRGGDVASIARVLAERGVDLQEGVKTGDAGGENLLITDPDGRPVFFDTTPPERLS